MAVYHFESVCESGFAVSGLLEADDESHARLKAESICGASNLLRVKALGPGPDGPHAETAGEAGHEAFRCETVKGRLVSLAVSIWGALLKERHFRRRAS